VAEFNQVVDMVGEESSAGENNLNAKDIYEIKVRVLNQLTEELIILEKAKAMGLSVTETEIDQAVQQIKADYPDNTFEETLLENAISYKIWRKKLASRLLIEKVIAKELVDQVTISAEDIADYYQKHYPEGTPEDAPAEDVNKRIVRHLRKQKAEQNYKAWIEKLRGVYSVELNRQQWERLINENSETD
jgi:hypothetical protein